MNEDKQQQLEHINDLGNALKQLALKGIVPQIVHYRESGPSAISLSFDELKLIAAGRPVNKTVDSMIVYHFDWQGVELLCHHIAPNQSSEQVTL
jgi:hypothetical protein